MISRYDEIAQKLADSPRTISVAVAHDAELLTSLAQAAEIAPIRALLFGDASRIAPMAEDLGISSSCRIIDEPDEARALCASVEAVHDGEAQVLMKGLVNTSDFMKAVLDKTIGLRTGRLLSHLASFELDAFPRLLFVSDGGINVAPALAEKKQILENALIALRALGYAMTNVAVLAANEQVSPKVSATVDAAELARMWQEGIFGSDCVVEGPVALDVALSGEAAAHKHIDSAIAGKTDLFIAPTIEVGNVLGKSMANIAGAKMAGIVVGASAPIVLTSRAESAVSKLNSVLLAAAASA